MKAFGSNLNLIHQGIFSEQDYTRNRPWFILIAQLISLLINLTLCVKRIEERCQICTRQNNSLSCKWPKKRKRGRRGRDEWPI